MILLCIPLIFCFSGPGYAIDVSFQWDANTEPDLAGYRVFCREQSHSYDYNNPIWEGTNTTCTIYDLDETKTFYFVLRTFDIYGSESIDSNELVFEADTTPDNQAPIADAGEDKVADQESVVILDGSNSSDPDDEITSYQWTQISGTAVTLSAPISALTTFIAPDLGPVEETLIFRLTVTNTDGLRGTDTCTITVNPKIVDVQQVQVALEWNPNNEPELAGYKVFCQEEGKSYDYSNPSWEGTDTTCTIYDLLETKTYCFIVRAFDTQGHESGDSNEVCFEAESYNGNQSGAPMPHVDFATGTPVNHSPVVDAGSDGAITLPDDTIFLNGTVTDDGLPDPPGMVIPAWSQVSGPGTVVFDDTGAVDTTATFSEAGTYVLQLAADDGGFISSDTVTITVNSEPLVNQPPIADAGEDKVADQESVVILDGSNSSDSILALPTVTFQWSAGSGVEEYYIGVGTSQASIENSPWGDIDAQSTGTSTSAEITGIPLDGNTVYVRLWYLINGVWDYYVDYTYLTLTLQPSLSTLKPVYATEEQIVVNFSNGPGNRLDWIGLFLPGATNYEYLDWLYVDGTQIGSTGYTDGSVTFISGLPSTGNYEVRFFENNGGIVLASNTFSVQSSVLTVSITEASISENGDSSQATVTRSTGTSGDLVVNLLSDDTSEATVPATVTILDGSDGATFTVTGVDDTIVDGVQTVTITASAAGHSDGTAMVDVNDDDGNTSMMLNPSPGTTLTSSTVTFQWSARSGVNEYWLGVGNSLANVDGSSSYGDIYGQSTGTSTSAIVSGIPLDGNPIYVWLWYKIDANWFFDDCTYQTN